MNRYRYIDENKAHLHLLDEKPLLGTTTCLGILDKPLTWWAAGQALEQRVTRAAQQAGEMAFTQTESGWIVETKGGCYRVTEQGCDCPDYRYRCAPRSLVCKHIVALGALKIEKGML